MRIGIDARLWNETGVGRYIRNLVRFLQELDRKNEYVLFVTSQKSLALSSRPSPKDAWRDLSHKTLAARDSSTSLGMTLKNNWKIVRADVRWHSIDEQLRLPSIIEKEKLDLVHFPYFSVPYLYSRPFIVTIHDLIPLHFDTGRASTLPLPLYKAKRLGYKLVLRRAAKKASKIIAVSNATKDEVVKHLAVDPDKVVVTHEGIDPLLYSSSEAKRSREVDSGRARMTVSSRLRSNNNQYFLYVGNAYPHKNLERLVEAFKLVILSPASPGEGSLDLSKNPTFVGDSSATPQNDMKLILVGKEDYFYRRLKDQVDLMGLSKYVVFHGPASDEELSALYQHAKALIMPSLMEGFGLPALEAMANRCLVLASDIAALRETCSEAAIYFNPYDVDDMTAKLKAVMEQSNSLDYRTKRENGIERVRLFSWWKMAEETLQVYEEVVKSS